MRRMTYPLAAAALIAAGCIGFDRGDAAWTTPPFSAEIVDLRQPTKPARRVYMGDGKLRLEDRDPTSPATLVFDPAHGTMMFISDKDRSYLDAGMLAPVIGAGFGPLLHLFRPSADGDPCAGLNATVAGLAAFARQPGSARAPHLTCRSLGADRVDGRPAQKWAVTEDTQNEQGTVWIDDRLHIIAKSTDRTSGTELRNVREGPQPASLFAAPAGYRKLGLGEMLNGLSKMTRSPSMPGGTTGNAAGDTLRAALNKLQDALHRQ